VRAAQTVDQNPPTRALAKLLLPTRHRCLHVLRTYFSASGRLWKWLPCDTAPISTLRVDLLANRRLPADPVQKACQHMAAVRGDQGALM